ncbi:MAG TPA: DNA methyltransferase [Polyangia bacterium]|nr:DNA methyltransferase [Polyangia bacterium]
MSARDADRLFHETWLGLAQPIEGLVFSVPVLAEAQIAPAARPEITAQLRALLTELPAGGLALGSTRALFETFLGYDRPGMLIGRDALPTFRAPESRQEVRPSFGIARTPPATTDDPFAEFDPPPATAPPAASDTAPANPVLALVWDLAGDAPDAPALDLDAPEEATGPWRYPPTAKLERLLRHTGIPVGFLSNGRQLRVVYAPRGETTSHLTFRMDDLADPAGRPLALVLDLLFHARRTYGAEARFTFEGLLAESRRRQADVTAQLAEQVFDAVEALLAGFEAAAARDGTGDRLDWLRPAMEAGQVYPGVLNTVLRLVFLLYAEDRSLMPVAEPLYAEHLSVLGLYERLVADAGAHPESMHHRFGAYGALVALFRAVYFGVRHGTLHLPPRQGKLFDPSAYPFLEGGLPDWTAAVNRAEDRAQVQLPSVDDKTIHDVLHGLVVLDGQRLSYRDLSVEQIGAVYESLMGYEVLRLDGPAVRLGKNGVWVTIEELRGAGKAEQKKLLEDRCELSAAAIKNVNAALAERAPGDDPDGAAAADAIAALSGKKRQLRNRGRLGQLVLQPTPSRRSTGSYYTPRSLSERVVRRTLEPVVSCLGPAPAAERILELKVCDPAMGSGAFLVEACRFLAEQVRAAWERGGALPALIEKHGEPLMHAKRLVAERCLYGVDKNPAAVELAKLSLWLETMSADKSFTFLDHVLRHGDSLVGLDLTQIRAFHWQPGAQLPTVARLVDQTLAEVREHREAIQAMADDDSAATQNEQRRLLELAELAMDRVKLVADACIGAFFAADKPKEREKLRKERLDAVEAWLGGDEGRRAEIEEWSREMRDKHPPFHWHLELPEVFFLERPDPLDDDKVNGAAFMDAFVGNPPFMGGTIISTVHGRSYLAWLTVLLGAGGDRADLSAHFFRRAGRLLGVHGAIGFVATNTISQGDTRARGLQHLIVNDAFTIFDATRSMEWPGEATVIVSIILLAKGFVARHVSALRLDDADVGAISSRLLPTPERPDPVRIETNVGAAYSGVKIYGQGFLLSDEEREELIRRDRHNGDRIFPYLGGDEVNSSPSQSHERYVVTFGQMPLVEAEGWPDLLALVSERVRPERDGKSAEVARTPWWQFFRPRTELYAVLSKMQRCLVASQVTKHLCFSFQPTDRIFSQKLIVFPLPAYTSFATLQSRIHGPWVWLLSSTMKNDLNYSPSDCFETFPFPQRDPRAVIPAVEAAGERLYTARAAYMVDTNQGLTQTYNHLKDRQHDDPRILELRALHEAMDRAVLDAYGWTDLAVPPFCPLTPDDTRALDAFQDTIIDRLFVLNAERAAEERRLGLGKPAPKRPKAKPASNPKPASQTALNLDDPDDQQ